MGFYFWVVHRNSEIAILTVNMVVKRVIDKSEEKEFEICIRNIFLSPEITDSQED